MNKFLILALTIFVVGCGKNDDRGENPYRTYTSGNKSITYAIADFKHDEPFPITYASGSTVVQCQLWLSGPYIRTYPRGGTVYSISNCNGEFRQSGGYELDGAGLVLCKDNLECTRYLEAR